MSIKPGYSARRLWAFLFLFYGVFFSLTFLLEGTGALWSIWGLLMLYRFLGFWAAHAYLKKWRIRHGLFAALNLLTVIVCLYLLWLAVPYFLHGMLLAPLVLIMVAPEFFAVWLVWKQKVLNEEAIRPKVEEAGLNVAETKDNKSKLRQSTSRNKQLPESLGCVAMLAFLPICFYVSLIPMCGNPIPPPNAQIVSHFSEHRATYERLRDMFLEDKGSSYDGEVYAETLSVERLAEYRQLLKAVDSKRVVFDDYADGVRVSFVFYSYGWAGGGHGKVILWSDADLEGFHAGDHYAPLGNGWYLRSYSH